MNNRMLRLDLEIRHVGRLALSRTEPAGAILYFRIWCLRPKLLTSERCVVRIRNYWEPTDEPLFFFSE